jgi:hypothetical protein
MTSQTAMRALQMTVQENIVTSLMDESYKVCNSLTDEAEKLSDSGLVTSVLGWSRTLMTSLSSGPISSSSSSQQFKWLPSDFFLLFKVN